MMEEVTETEQAGNNAAHGQVSLMNFFFKKKLNNSFIHSLRI